MINAPQVEQGRQRPPFTFDQYRATVPKIFTPLTELEWRQLSAATETSIEELKADNRQNRVVDFLLSVQPDPGIPSLDEELNKVILKTHKDLSAPVLEDVIGLLRSYSNSEVKKMWEVVEKFHLGEVTNDFRPIFESGLNMLADRQLDLHANEVVSMLQAGDKITGRDRDNIHTLLKIIERETIRDHLAEAEGTVKYDEKHGAQNRKEMQEKIDKGGEEGKRALQYAINQRVFSPVKIPGLMEDIKYFKQGEQVIGQMKELISSLTDKAEV